MAGLCYQWLKSDLSVGQAGELRTGELLLLRVRVHAMYRAQVVIDVFMCSKLSTSARLDLNVHVHVDSTLLAAFCRSFT